MFLNNCRYLDQDVATLNEYPAPDLWFWCLPSCRRTPTFVHSCSTATITDGTQSKTWVGINDCVFNRKSNENVIDPDGPIRFWLDQQIVETNCIF